MKINATDCILSFSVYLFGLLVWFFGLRKGRLDALILSFRRCSIFYSYFRWRYRKMREQDADLAYLMFVKKVCAASLLIGTIGLGIQAIQYVYVRWFH